MVLQIRLLEQARAARPCGRGKLAQFSLLQRFAVWWVAPPWPILSVPAVLLALCRLVVHYEISLPPEHRDLIDPRSVYVHSPRAATAGPSTMTPSSSSSRRAATATRRPRAICNGFVSPGSRSRPQEKRNPQGSPWGKRKAVFSVCRVKTVGSTEEEFPLLTLGLAGYGGASIRHQLKEGWRQTKTL